MLTPREMKEKQERLSPYAQPSSQSRGRRFPLEPCSVRTVYERDLGRIIYSTEFRRLRQKTQVFFNPRNDHICTRMEHVIYVSYIATTIGRALDLNVDLISAIAMGHDLGHAPFGHTGEAELRECLQDYDAGFTFNHEAHSLRVVDLLAQHKSRHGLNLTFEVRDGIVSHCGEQYHEYVLVPNRDKTEEDLHIDIAKHPLPSTLEGCVVRMADKIAYVGRDIEDAVRAGIMSFEDIPDRIKTELGATNGEIINTQGTDIIRNSSGKDMIALSDANGEAMEELLKENTRRIYRSERINRYEIMTRNVVRGLFEAFIKAPYDPERDPATLEQAIRDFHDYIRQHPEPDTEHARLVADYIAGMTDHYAQKTFESLYLF